MTLSTLDFEKVNLNFEYFLRYCQLPKEKQETIENKVKEMIKEGKTF